eukprot:COSAG01_NODE_12275_length_1768_cov_13.306171_2_plen_237_part_00
MCVCVCVCGQSIIHVRAQLFKVLVKKGGKAAVRDLAVPEKASLSTVKRDEVREHAPAVASSLATTCTLHDTGQLYALPSLSSSFVVVRREPSTPLPTPALTIESGSRAQGLEEQVERDALKRQVLAYNVRAQEEERIQERRCGRRPCTRGACDSQSRSHRSAALPALGPRRRVLTPRPTPLPRTQRVTGAPPRHGRQGRPPDGGLSQQRARGGTVGHREARRYTTHAAPRVCRRGS